MTDAERERLAILAEEMAEAIHIIGKILRHGYESTHPNGGPTNRNLLEEELGHVQYGICLLSGNGDISQRTIDEHHIEKVFSIQPYLHFQSTPSARF